MLITRPFAGSSSLRHLHHPGSFGNRLGFLSLMIILLIPGWNYTDCQELSHPGEIYSHADSLRGSLTPERRCYDVRFYHLDVTIDPAQRYISGANTILFSVDSAFNRMQVDLFANMAIDTVTLDDDPSPLAVTRDSNAFFVTLPSLLPKGSKHAIRIAYSGHPLTALRPPWDGGFTWGSDSAGNPWVNVTCQGTGASLWWPNKDHQSDKPDSMQISITIPDPLMDISNGRLRSITTVRPGWKKYDWFVSYPINNYNVTCNIGIFAHFSDTYLSGSGDTLALDYYVLPRHLGNAEIQFQQVRKMLRAFERDFGPYPFIRDGYKLIECSHTGMEHQSAVAYGNRFLGGYRGFSSSEVGLKFDFIIVHESAHEWWGNNVTASDVADMWIHESFGAYAEALYVEEEYGREASLTYINAKKQNVRNDSPIAGVYNVQKEGSGDMYDKGQLVLNTLRSVINNDTLWFSILRNLQTDHRYGVVSYDDIVSEFSRRSGMDLGWFFDQYIRHTHPPKLECMLIEKGPDVTLRYRWDADAAGFRMPVRVTLSNGKFGTIEPSDHWQKLMLHDIHPDEFRTDEQHYYFDLKLTRMYEDPRRQDQE